MAKKGHSNMLARAVVNGLIVKLKIIAIMKKIWIAKNYSMKLILRKNCQFVMKN